MSTDRRGRLGRPSEGGFTLVELLMTMALLSIVLTLAAFELRQFWFVRSLEGGKNEMITTLRGIQQRVTSASNPLVYGGRFTVGSSEWELIQYNRTSTPPACTSIRLGDLDPRQEFGAGVRVSSASFTDYVDERPTGSVNVTDICRGSATDIVWFYARGSATAGQVGVTQPVLGRSETVCVSALTGRVSEGEGGSC